MQPARPSIWSHDSNETASRKPGTLHLEGNSIVLFHTEVPSECTGRGIGSRLAQGVFDLLRASGRKAILTCPFMSRFFANHLDYLDVIAG